MPGSLSNYAEKKVLDHLLKTTAWSPNPITLYMALGTAKDDAGVTTEFSSGNYARKSITVAEFGTVASGRSIVNDAAITFITANATWGTPSVWGIYDASSGGNCIATGTIVGAGEIGNGDTGSLAIGEVEIQWNAHVSNNGWSDAIVHAMLDHIMFGTEHTPATNLYVGFGTTPLTDSGSISGEASGGGYARINCNAWDAAAGDSPSLADNTGAISFTVSGDWTASLDVVFIADHLTNTANVNLLFFGTIASMSPVNGDTVEIVAGDLDVTLA